MAYDPLSARLASLPLVICGPLLRRVTTTSVTVFVALRQARRATLSVSSLAGGGGAGNPSFGSAATSTIQIGTNLHVLAVTATGAVVPGKTYVYDVRFEPMIGAAGSTQALMDPGVVAATSADAKAALTYQSTVPGAPSLPSFTAPPSDPNQLRVIHYSCRKPHADGTDALPTVDEMIENALAGARPQDGPRPHLLLHTGDQIYADDVSDLVLLVLIDAADALLGWTFPGETLPAVAGNVAPRTLRPGRRAATAAEGKMTSSAAASHLFGYGEFCAMYLHAWSPTLWPATLPAVTDLTAGAADYHEVERRTWAYNSQLPHTPKPSACSASQRQRLPRLPV